MTPRARRIRQAVKRYTENTHADFVIGMCVWLAALLLTSLAFGQSPFLLRTADTTYLVFPVDGEPELIPLDSLVVIDWTGDDPPPPTTPTLVNDVQRWAEQVDDSAESQKYALIFATVRGGLQNVDIAPSQSFPVLSKSADAILKSDWVAFRRQLTEYTTKERRVGRLATSTQTMNFCAMVQHGLELSADGSGKISRDERDRVVAAVNELIDEARQ